MNTTTTATTEPTFFRASDSPREVIESLPRRPDQDPKMRQYVDGFAYYLNLLPILRQDDPNLAMKTEVSGIVMKTLATDLIKHALWLNPNIEPMDFCRHILAVEDPQMEPMAQELATLFSSGPNATHVLGQKAWDAYLTPERRAEMVIKEGVELLVAHWGVGFSTPVHGHGAGLLHEEILFGKMRVHTYRTVRDGVVRPIRTDIAEKGTLVSKFSAPDPRGPRMGLVHNFTAVEPSASLHFVPEHTRDGRDNKFTVEHFTESMGMTENNVYQISGDEGRHLRVGDVCLVRSANVPEYADHFIVITGAPKLKAHGLRPDDVAIQASPAASQILDLFTPQGKGGAALTLLKLNKETARTFLEWHDINLWDNDRIVFPVA